MAAICCYYKERAHFEPPGQRAVGQGLRGEVRLPPFPPVRRLGEVSRCRSCLLHRTGGLGPGLGQGKEGVPDLMILQEFLVSE